MNNLILDETTDDEEGSIHRRESTPNQTASPASSVSRRQRHQVPGPAPKYIFFFIFIYYLPYL